MKTNRYIFIAITLIAIVCLSYVLNFYVKLSYVISDEPEAWGQLGDFVGGLINPILSFMSLLFIIKSLSLQNEANIGLREEVKNTRKTEKLRSFETQLFHMIASQRELFSSLKVNDISYQAISKKMGVEAVIVIETEVERLRESFDLDIVNAYLEAADPTDQIYGLTRIFYNIVKLTSEKLSDANEFSAEDRKSHYLTLINFTDFSLLRLIMLSAQFTGLPPTEYLKSNQEFSSTLKEVGLNYSLY
ncbi:hypothetical protein NYP20_09115 [Pseudomonas sp. N3-W]|uniref:hypothetical protein n=1 Tax=Pseudomonas sp. N3-W TaxID=2975049 RepID=UPI00217CF873|nr:hypothetical protein [Pseudomonas sp. N3-W]UWF51102.1 hypothetical protein NYP20_09115 [Pseudomonas sp. N3-W]